MDRGTSNGYDDVARPNSSFGTGGIRNDVPSNDTLLGIHPGHSIIGENEIGALLVIEDGENDGCQCKQG
jgi:hypothetical protein